ncbi:WAT1-related protein [Glycine soja]
MTLMAAIQATVYAFCFETDLSQWKLGSGIRLLTTLYTGIVAIGLVNIATSWCVRNRGPLFASIFYPFCLVLVTFASFLLLEEHLYLGRSTATVQWRLPVQLTTLRNLLRENLAQMNTNELELLKNQLEAALRNIRSTIVSFNFNNQHSIKETMSSATFKVAVLGSGSSASFAYPFLFSLLGVESNASIGRIEWLHDEKLWSLIGVDGQNLGQYKGLVASDNNIVFPRVAGVIGRLPPLGMNITIFFS